MGFPRVKRKRERESAAPTVQDKLRPAIRGRDHFMTSRGSRSSIQEILMTIWGSSSRLWSGPMRGCSCAATDLSSGCAFEGSTDYYPVAGQRGGRDMVQPRGFIRGLGYCKGKRQTYRRSTEVGLKLEGPGLGSTTVYFGHHFIIGSATSPWVSNASHLLTRTPPPAPGSNPLLKSQ